MVEIYCYLFGIFTVLLAEIITRDLIYDQWWAKNFFLGMSLIALITLILIGSLQFGKFLIFVHENVKITISDSDYTVK